MAQTSYYKTCIQINLKKTYTPGGGGGRGATYIYITYICVAVKTPLFAPDLHLRPPFSSWPEHTPPVDHVVKKK